MRSFDFGNNEDFKKKNILSNFMTDSTYLAESSIPWRGKETQKYSVHLLVTLNPLSSCMPYCAFENETKNLLTNDFWEPKLTITYIAANIALLAYIGDISRSFLYLVYVPVFIFFLRYIRVVLLR